MRPRSSKAFLLAAGLGTRLRPLTYEVPKCLVPICGRPLLSIWIDFCQQLGVTEVLINTHYLANQVREWASRQESPIRIHLVHEKELLGSAGTIRNNWDFIANEESFYIFYADNLLRLDLSGLIAFHHSHSDPLTVGLFEAAHPEQCGIVQLDSEHRIFAFAEKPAQPRSNLANAGIYIARQALREYLPAGIHADFGKDVLPRMVGKARATLLGGYVQDIGTLEAYQVAQTEWGQLSREGRVLT